MPKFVDSLVTNCALVGITLALSHNVVFTNPSHVFKTGLLAQFSHQLDAAFHTAKKYVSNLLNNRLSTQSTVFIIKTTNLNKLIMELV